MNSRIELHLEKEKCPDDCGNGEHAHYCSEDNHSKDPKECWCRQNCKWHCENGYIRKVLEFEWTGMKSHKERGCYSHRIDYRVEYLLYFNYRDFAVEFIKYKDNKQVEDDLNPEYLEIISVEDCPECLRKHEHIKLGIAISHKRCDTCNTFCRKDLPIGKIERVTQKVLFKPEEYAERIRADIKWEYIKNYDHSGGGWIAHYEPYCQILGVAECAGSGKTKDLALENLEKH